MLSNMFVEKGKMVKLFALGFLSLFHASWASKPNAEINEASIREMEAKFIGLIQVMQQEIAEIKRHLSIYDENINTATLGKADGINDILMNDTDLEERVTFLEFQMSNVNEELVALTDDLIDVENGVENVEGQVTVILADQVMQDERLLELETDSESVAIAIFELDNSINILQTADVALNDSIHVLDSRVSALEELNATIVDLTLYVQDLHVLTSDLASQIDELTTRIGQLEQDGTGAFHAFLGVYSSIPQGSVIVFPNINVNIGNGYSGATGEFTVPSGGAGLYYLYGHFLFEAGNLVWIRMQVNGADLCVAFEDGLNAISYGGASCGAIVQLQEGSFIKIIK